MYSIIKITRGLDLKLNGFLPERPEIFTINAPTVAVTPDDFNGFIPKLEIKEGDEVKEGSPLFHDKNHEDIKLCSPVQGIVRAVVRGQRRKILRIEIERIFSSDQGINLAQRDNKGIENLGDKADIKRSIQQSGLWCYLRQLPYAIVPSPDKEPRDIFVTSFDSAPLSGDLLKTPYITEENVNAGIKILSRLTDGKVYLSVRESLPFEVKDAETVVVTGPHPAGLPSIQAGNIKPVNKGKTVWLLDIITVAKIGQFFLTGRYSHETLVAVTGSEIKSPHYVLTIEGAPIKEILGEEFINSCDHKRIISGNVLSGHRLEKDGYLRFPYRQLTVIPEGDNRDEFMGWASLSPAKLSTSRSFPLSRLRSFFSPDARLNGGRRAMIMSGLYERMIPLDIMPEYLIKAILSKDVSRMEQLGIYEVTPEDFALAEFVDPSKLELQKIVREGLDYMRKEVE